MKLFVERYHIPNFIYKKKFNHLDINKKNLVHLYDTIYRAEQISFLHQPKHNLWGYHLNRVEVTWSRDVLTSVTIKKNIPARTYQI